MRHAELSFAANSPVRSHPRWSAQMWAKALVATLALVCIELSEWFFVDGALLQQRMGPAVTGPPLAKPREAGDFREAQLARDPTLMNDSDMDDRSDIDDPAPSSTLDLTPGVRRSARLIQLFLDHVPEQLDELGAAVDAGDAKGARAHAHKLKGSCLALMAEPMAQVAEKLQRKADAGDLSDAPELMEELAERFMVVAALLRQELGE
jgi:HPt (histidine-containing phosphotransfer) domain-containing protein